MAGFQVAINGRFWVATEDLPTDVSFFADFCHVPYTRSIQMYTKTAGVQLWAAGPEDMLTCSKRDALMTSQGIQNKKGKCPFDLERPASAVQFRPSARSVSTISFPVALKEIARC
jgi:hypothetical protein